ncbi:MAG: transcription elongation factor GreA [Clostridia bacterium]
MADFYVTKKGYKELEDRLTYLKTIARQEISQKISEARSFGDISENAEYDAAKDEQARVEGEIIDLDAKVRRAVIISEFDGDTSVVKIGFIIKVVNNANREVKTFQIVGSTEIKPLDEVPKISNESPVGKALLGKCVGQTAVIELPNGKKLEYEILEITK